MDAHPLKPESLCQIGLVVHDIEATARRYVEAFGVPMPAIVETPGYSQARTTLDGAPSEATARLAFMPMGQVTIELIEPDCEPSVWREFLETHGEGVHHIAFHVTDTREAEAALAAHGIATRQQGLYADASGQYTYLDSAPQLGVMIELLETFERGPAGRGEPTPPDAGR